MNEAELFRKDKFCKLRKKNKKDKQGSTIKTLNLYDQFGQTAMPRALNFRQGKVQSLSIVYISYKY